MERVGTYWGVGRWACAVPDSLGCISESTGPLTLHCEPVIAPLAPGAPLVHIVSPPLELTPPHLTFPHHCYPEMWCSQGMILQPAGPRGQLARLEPTALALQVP